MYNDINKLYYFNYGSYYGNIITTEYTGKYFMLPNGMSEKDAFKVLSYLFEAIHLRVRYDNNDPQKIITTINILNDILPYYGFYEPTDYAGYEEHQIVNLFIANDEYNFFDSIHYYDYVKWYKKKVSLNNVLNIYNKLNMEFRDIDEVINENINSNKLVKKRIG